MVQKTNLVGLKELKEALEQLSKQTLPVQTRGIVQTARQRLSQLERDLRESADHNRLAALYRVSQSLGVSLNLDDVLTQVMDAVIELTGAERGFLTLIDAHTKELHLRAARNIERETLYHEDMEVSRTVIQSVVENGKGVVTTDAQSDPRFAGQESVVVYSLKSILCAPLRARGDIIGVIYVENRAQSGIFTNEDLELLNTFASQAAVAIDNARLYTRTDQALSERVAELETINQIDQELNARLDLPHVLELTCQWAVRGTGASQSWITLFDEESGTLQLAAGPLEGETPAPNSRVIAAILEKPSPQTITSADGRYKYLVAPLRQAGETIGGIIISTANGGPLDDSALQYLGRLAGRATAAIENARLYQEVQQANESKSQFVALVTHELRIPLTSIKGYTDLIRQGAVGEVNEQQVSFLDVIRNNVERMAALISDLSDISRIERGKIKLELEAIYLQPYIEETLSGLQHRLDEKSQSLDINAPTALPKIYADPTRLVQVLTNLVSNAWKYTLEGGHICINAQQADSFLRVEVVDNGIGISEEDQAKLFTQFFRSDSPAVREQTGWGLGLNVTKKLVEVMGGEIGSHSVLGEGSTFWFTVPLAN
jgi:signal transduction histidine kinase